MQILLQKISIVKNVFDETSIGFGERIQTRLFIKEAAYEMYSRFLKKQFQEDLSKSGVNDVRILVGFAVYHSGILYGEGYSTHFYFRKYNISKITELYKMDGIAWIINEEIINLFLNDFPTISLENLEKIESYRRGSYSDGITTTVNNWFCIKQNKYEEL